MRWCKKHSSQMLKVSLSHRTEVIWNVPSAEKQQDSQGKA